MAAASLHNAELQISTLNIYTEYLHRISTQNIYTEYLLSVSAVDTQRGGDNVSGAAQWGRGSAGLVTM